MAFSAISSKQVCGCQGKGFASRTASGIVVESQAFASVKNSAQHYLFKVYMSSKNQLVLECHRREIPRSLGIMEVTVKIVLYEQTSERALRHVEFCITSALNLSFECQHLGDYVHECHPLHLLTQIVSTLQSLQRTQTRVVGCSC